MINSSEKSKAQALGACILTKGDSNKSVNVRVWDISSLKTTAFMAWEACISLDWMWKGLRFSSVWASYEQTIITETGAVMYTQTTEIPCSLLSRCNMKRYHTLNGTPMKRTVNSTLMQLPILSSSCVCHLCLLTALECTSCMPTSSSISQLIAKS